MTKSQNDNRSKNKTDSTTNRPYQHPVTRNMDEDTCYIIIPLIVIRRHGKRNERVDADEEEVVVRH
jgi:hypothetical protein